MAYSLDLRERIVEAVAEGQQHAEVAVRFKVGVATVRRYLSRGSWQPSTADSGKNSKASKSA